MTEQEHNQDNRLRYRGDDEEYIIPEAELPRVTMDALKNLHDVLMGRLESKTSA